MATAPINTNIRYPQSPFLDPLTQRPAREWLQWLQYPDLIALNLANALAVASGGTGTTVIPSNGQLLIGNGTGYTVNSPTAGTGIGIVLGAGTLQFNNTGVTSIIAGAGISASSATGAVTIANTGVLSFSGGTTGLTPATSTVGAITLAGTLNIANGGTGATTASGARTNLGAAASGANSDITSLSGLTTALSILQGGTGATTASGARTNLGLGSGLSVTITTAKLTTIGTNGSMTFINGILTAQTAAT
jgi:hypothetical protein